SRFSSTLRGRAESERRIGGMACNEGAVDRRARSPVVSLVPHHGGDDVVYPATFAVKPRVAIMNSAEKKGGSRDTFANLRKVAGLEDVWQLHKSLAAGAQNYPDDQVANLDETTAHWLKVSASDDGSFSVTNGRTGTTRTHR